MKSKMLTTLICVLC